MSDYLEDDYNPIIQHDLQSRFLDDRSIEVMGDFQALRPPRHALFDFDGTLSLIREGWPDVMIPMMVEVLREADCNASIDELHALTSRFVMELNGKQTIYQMIRLAEEVTARGGTPLDPMDYKREYHDRLMQRIDGRREALRSGSAPVEDMLVPGAFEILEHLQSRNVQLYLASGTDEAYVREEVSLLQLDRFFGDRVHGAVDDYREFSKARVIERILDQHAVSGDELLGFGDGYVEIQNVRSVGGTAVAVASDESHRSGQPDPWKRERLIGAGANLVIPDFSESKRLVEFLFDVPKKGVADVTG
ncbi:MAG: HAD hydrolase-like protein [Planctomycetota bacterium]|nr:HAD hydrolase-like protein [Planctomycetota bacterium]